MQEVVVIDYGMGNLHSVQKALSFWMRSQNYHRMLRKYERRKS